MKVDEAKLKADHLPWAAESDPVHGASIRDAKGNQIVAYIYDEENAAIITKAVNSHEALLSALKVLLCYSVELDDARLDYITAHIDRDAIKEAQAVIDLVEKGQR